MIISYVQIGLALLLIIAILLQQRGSGLSSAFGGSSIEYSTKRGAEKVIFNATIILAILFFSISLWRIIG
ncbi:MAG: preprotein translocase subunit SecG [Candidatus Yanofskybacteria bacterium RIFCSPLOWO2_12_FULL_44_13b]|uniref:Protein-export membrane protein SecG n=1 Tax=Candidatus Yanofskybacteria bacterium RIFCSPLOWO2_02_FULL_44_18 TaxID=1802705 RepID=A0A1F8H087_9BACT|nr:MAG: preprotein translocase subunit SecG [Candidatus Yanofskybacteria bacterium RIFCSPHIGHO2_01_FULL_44_110b]OGN14227.1 MAG: preprotein translocase subunit SecG [Candidatus Yanofskybacteria bacterium RIFCSPHIGHO2_02_FULL_44_36b]OGN18585.1 MAG: preprotein translocase subunit SecG [Candidatus Yanofskybacteria bacterium RIFCSPHIGHO2_12_FULL_44_29b]OGN25638.1 MAG: preprotein translocase subunit SecG [Candidatus Yanofskybacteria bacterium RIFCSPLOWO2_01_FULL_44_88]OGN31093.1 MAG: preprotein trans